ncbi:hypothetical protein D3C79_655220 [compost metagenome]
MLPLPGPHTDKQSEVLTLTTPLADPAALTTLLQQQEPDGLAETRTTVTPPQTLPTPSGPLTLPARWELKAVTLSQSLAASYVVGTLEVRIERQQANFAASLNRLHRGMGTGLPWQLFGDLAALALLLLTLTSLLMWNKLHGPPRRGIALLLGGALATLLIALL